MRATACSLRNNAFQPAPPACQAFGPQACFPRLFYTAASMLTTSLIFSVVFFVAVLVSALVGLAICLHSGRAGPARACARHDRRRDGPRRHAVALVLGLLIWTAFGFFSTQKAELQGIAANALEFNQETREYGPEAAHARALMRADLDYGRIKSLG